MAESKIQNSFSRTTILTVGKLLLFIAAGFAIGLVVGVASEEPRLLAGHLRGDSATIELDGALAERVENSESAARALAAHERAEAEAGGEGVADDETGAAAAAQDALPDVAAAPPGGAAFAFAGGSARDENAAGPGPGSAERWAIQVGAFGDEPSANRLVEQLEAKGYSVAVLPASADSNRWRVRVQPLASEGTARATAARIEREERLPIWVIRLEGSTSE